ADSWMFVTSAVMGYQAADANANLAAFSGANQQVKAGTDLIIINRGLPNDRTRVTGHNKSAAAQFKLTENASYRKGDILMMVSPTCDMAAIFQLTGPAATSSNVYTHGVSGGVSPGNCSLNLSFGGDCASAPTSNNLGRAFPDGSMVMGFSSAAYFIRDSQITGEPTLYRQVRTRTSGALQSQELLTGVDDMDILYGYNPAGSGSPERFYPANLVPDWSGVVSVRIQLTLVSKRAVFAPDATANPPQDGKLRKQVMISGSIRNRG
ncbi:MAG: PilW family protein, partial [Cellvibrionaceae bacterium]|nr:PilW family protein [Cellvibrionaceae bacterium]